MRNLACWTIGQLLAAYIVVVGLLSAVVVPTAHYLLLSKEQTSVVIATHEELYWTFAQLQLSLERISEEAGKFALNRSTPELLRTRWDVLNSKYNMMSTDSVVTQSLEAVLPGYRDALTDVGNFVADAQKEIENPDARTMRQLMDGVQDLRPMVIEMAIQARASELKARAAQSADINRNHIVVFTAISGMWLFFAVAGFGVLTSRRGMALQLSQKQALLELEKHAKEEAVKAEISRNTFLGKVSHEINSPVQAILTNVQLLKRRIGTDPEMTKISRRLETSVNQLRVQIEDLLDVSEIKSGKMTLKLNTVDVSLIAEDVVAVQQVSAELKGLSLYLTTANLQHCRTDCQRIAQIITNLVSNAIRYTERGRVDVHLRMTSEGLQTALKIVVRDTGIGIAPEMQDGVFQPFMQVAKTRGGSGLGLAIVKGLVEQMGGTIGLESQLGSGSQFTVTLPVTVVIPAAAEPAPVPAKVPLDDIEHAVTAQEQTLAPGRGPAVKTSVLLVEDDMDIQETMADLLVSLGYHCETASSVEEALEYLPEANYSAIVLDMELANRSGLEVAVAARGFQSEHCVLIAVTAHAALLNQPGMEVFDARLSKPVDLDAVVAALNIKRLAPRI